MEVAAAVGEGGEVVAEARGERGSDARHGAQATLGRDGDVGEGAEVQECALGDVRPRTRARAASSGSSSRKPHTPPPSKSLP